MRDSEREAIVARYEKRLRVHGGGAGALATLATGTEERERQRFDVLAGVGDLQGKRVVDLGCGTGNFYGYLKERGISVDYCGYDITPGFVAHAQARFPEAQFEVRDIQESMPEQRFDYAVCSQVFNNRFQESDNELVVADVMARLFALSESGVAIDMVTSFVDYEQEHLFYFDPAQMFRHAKKLTRRVVLRHDYPLFEFCLYLYPSFEGWGTQH